MWNFLEVGYWKGFVDGIGGVIEWVVDVFIVNGGIIINIKFFMFVILWKIKVEMFDI